MEHTLSTNSAELQELFIAAKGLEALSPQKAIHKYEELIYLSIKKEDFITQIDSQIQAANLNRKQGLVYKALRHAGAALQLIKHHIPNDNYRLALCCKELGVIYADGLKKYSVALEYFFKALQCDVSQLNSLLFNNIGSVYKDSKHFNNAIKYLEKGKKLAIANKDSYTLVFLLENLGRVYMAQHQNDKAIHALQEALNVSNEAIKTNQSVHYIRGYVLNALAEIYLQTGRDAEAFLLIDEAYKIAEEKNHLTVIIESLKNKALYAQHRGDDQQFFAAINRAIAYMEDENLIHEKSSCLELLKQFYWSRKEYKKACLVADQIIQHKASIDKTHENLSMANVLEERESEIVILEEKNRMISWQKDELEQFAYIVAHDLKEPLRNIGNYSGLIKKRYNDILDKEGAEFLSFIISNATHMYKMLEDLLHYATLKGEDHSLKVADANEIIKNITYRIKDKINSTQTTINYTGLPALNIRPIHLDIIFDNLIKNAIKFRSPDRRLCIDINATQKDNYFCFSIKDNGKGISKAYYDTIFQIFKRLDRVNYAGTGIGLAVCKKIVETYRGKIWVESEIDVGSTFYFTIRKE